MKITFTHDSSAGKAGTKYVCKFAYSITQSGKTREFDIELIAVSNPGIPGTYVRLAKISDKSTGKTLPAGTEYEVLSKIANIISISNNVYKTSHTIWKFNDREILAPPMAFDVDTEVDVINIEGVSEKEVRELVTSKKFGNAAYIFSSVSELGILKDKLNKLITEDAKESLFQSAIMEHQNLLPIIFPSYKAVKSVKEFKLSADEFFSENKIDIAQQTEDKTLPSVIIELKRPSTKIFSTANERNNALGISSEFGSAIVQANSYRDRIMKSNTLTKDVTVFLIIGKNLEDKDAKRALELVKMDTRINILTYDEVIERIDSLILFFEGDSAKNINKTDEIFWPDDII